MRSTIVVGEFDGMHLGHRALVTAARRIADRARQPLVAVVLDDVAATERLSSIDDRLRSLLAAGCTSAIAVPADSSGTSERSDRLVARIVEVTNADTAVFACLPSRHEDALYPSLRSGFTLQGVQVVEVDRLRDADEVAIVGSSIRVAVRAGAVDTAGTWLGRPYSLRGDVVHGAGLGRTIGFATANVRPPEGRLIPARGVYAARVTLQDGSAHTAAVNIGHRPTVEGNGRLLIEAHLLDFDADIYDTPITIAFERWLRSELRFSGIDELVAQLALDIADVRRGQVT